MNGIFVELNGWDTVVVNGPDAAKFLQGQLTCDVYALADHAFTFGAACNNKGRIFAIFILARHGADFHVLLGYGLAKVFVANLQKFIPFYKCSMQIAPALKAIGLSGPEVASVLEKLNLEIPPVNETRTIAGMQLYNLLRDNTQFILVAHEDDNAAIKSSINTLVPEAKFETWELKNILSGHFPFTLEDVDKYTPQELHLAEAGYISFSKGCYTGQEIVARMHYRGKAKKALYLLEIKNMEELENKNEIEIFDDNGKKLGSPLKQVVDDNQRLYVIVALPVELASTGLFTKEGQAFAYQPFMAATNAG